MMEGLGCFVGGEIVTLRSGWLVRCWVAVFVSLVYVVLLLALGTKYQKLFEISETKSRDVGVADARSAG